MNRTLRNLLAGDATVLAAELNRNDSRTALTCVAAIVVGCGIYGFTLGLWRDGLQSAFTAIKFPLVVLLTCAGNALLNGCLALGLGSGLGFRQTTLAILMSFAIAAILLAAFAPVMLFLLWNTPPLENARSTTGHSVTLLAHVALIAWAGLTGNQRLLRLVREVSGSDRTSWFVLASWLGGNLLLGSQLTWIFRPFIGSPNLPVQFLRDDPFEGNFFESVHRSLSLLIN